MSDDNSCATRRIARHTPPPVLLAVYMCTHIVTRCCAALLLPGFPQHTRLPGFRWLHVAPPGNAPSCSPSLHASSTPTRSHTAPCHAMVTGSSQHHRMRLDATSQRWPNLGTPGQACPVTPVPQTAKQPNLHCSTHSPCLACRAAMDIPGAKPLPTPSMVRCC
jgi:hypothetical protein